MPVRPVLELGEGPLVLFRAFVLFRQFAEKRGKFVRNRLVQHSLIGTAKAGSKRLAPGRLLNLAAWSGAILARSGRLVGLIRHYNVTPGAPASRAQPRQLPRNLFSEA